MTDEITQQTVPTPPASAVAVVQPASTAVASPIQGLAMADLAADAGLGTENIGAEDRAIPFISLLQSNSPQCKKTDGKYIAGAQEGMMLNSVSRELASSLMVVPVFYERKALEWKPDRGGLVAVHDADADIVKTAVRTVNTEGKTIDLLPNGNSISITAQHYVLVMREGGLPAPAIISMASTQLKRSRRWNALIDDKKLQDSTGRVFTPPSFAFMYKLTAAAETKDTNSWWSWDMADAGAVQSRAVYEMAKAFHQSLKAGANRATAEQLAASVSHEAAEETAQPSAQQAAPAAAAGQTDAIPF